MVRLTVALRASSGRRAEELLETLRFLIASTRLEQGCEKCTVSVDPDFTVHYDELWATQADVRRRVRSSEFTSLLGLMECASEPPDVQFDFVTRARGLDFVAEVRAESGEEPSCEDPPGDIPVGGRVHET